MRVVALLLAVLGVAALAACDRGTPAPTTAAPASATVAEAPATVAEAPTTVAEAPTTAPVASAGHDHAAALAAAPLPGTSVLHLDDVWTDHHGRAVRLGDLRGHPLVVVMFYGTCVTACPVLVHDAELIEQALPADLRADTRFLMVSFDPVVDTPERLAAYAVAKGLDRAGWSFLGADERAVRRLAGVLGVRYRPDGRGGFSHTNLITVLDRDGVPVARLEGLALGPDAAVAALAGTD